MIGTALGGGLISMLLGMVSAAIPKAFDLADKKLTFAQEMKIREHEAMIRLREQEFALKAQTVQADAKINESYYEAVQAEAEASRQLMMQQIADMTKPTGYAFLDALNAAIRPLTTVFFLVLFGLGLVSWMFGVGTVNDEFGKSLGALFAFSVECVLFFIFGARQVQKPAQIAR